MNGKRWIAVFSLAVILSGLAAWGLSGLTSHLIVAIDRWGGAAPNVAPTLAKVNQALDTVNAPCAGNAPCRGTLGVLNKTIVKVGDAVVTTQLVERAVAPHTVAAVDALKVSADALTATSNAATKSVYALGRSSDALTGTLNAATTTINAAQGPLNAVTQDANDLDALLKDRAIHDTLTNTAAISGNVAGITRSLDLIGAHLEQTVDKPQPAWKAIVPGAELGAKLYACAFHHVCVN